MKSMILALLFDTLSFNVYAQTKTVTDMKPEIKKSEELIQEYLGMVKTYSEKHAYYLQVNKTGCRLLVRPLTHEVLVPHRTKVLNMKSI